MRFWSGNTEALREKEIWPLNMSPSCGSISLESQRCSSLPASIIEWLHLHKGTWEMRAKNDKRELSSVEEVPVRMERKGKRPRIKGCFRCCSCVKLAKLVLLSLAALMLLNILTGLNLNNRAITKATKSIASYLFPADVANLFQQGDRLQGLYEKQCQRESNAFSDSSNQTLYSYANKDTDEARLKYALSEMLDERFTISFDRLLHKPKFAFMRGRFMLRLKTLAQNMRMNYDPGVMQGLVANVKMHIDRHYQSLNSSGVNLYQRYNNCAIIGNSGELLSSTRGQFIDEHDAVIRVNNARAKPGITVHLPNPVTRYIGSKTTIMFMNSHILHQCARASRCQCHPYGVEVPIVLYLCDVEHILEVSMCGSVHKTPLFVTDRRFDLLVTKVARWYSLKNFFKIRAGFSASKWRQWELLHEWEAKHKHEFHYSSGMQAVVLALGICDHVNLFGFGKNPRFMHHFHSLQQVEHYGHDYQAEYSFYRDLADGRVNANPFLCEAGTYIPPLRVFH